MKNIFLLLFIAFITNLGFSQAPPQGINYQAVVYSDNGENEPGLNVPGQVLRNKNIRVRFTIIQNATNGTQVYKESHTKTTDAFGMFSLVIGQGVQEGSNAFANINWGAGIHFLKVEIDKRGGTNYVTMSNQQLLSVPYALYSDKSTFATTAGNGIASVSDNGNGSLTFTYADGSTYTTPLLTGLQGPQGIQGATGAQGPAGQNGTNGANGQNGTDGINGLNGANGQNGLSAYEIWLAQGNTGTEQDFLTAIIGAQGPQGIQGVDGQNGANGQNGVDGINGTNGVNGQNGLSAYEIWLAQGNSGTEQDFLTAITGATGAQGIQGLQGVAGPTGATGAQGPIGLTGATGATGPQGIQGVAGSNGTNGADGKNTLAKTTTEAAGANCTTGGVKIEYGLDANNNGTLDVSEINASLTKYVCNGAVGATGAQGIQGATGATGAQGIQGVAGATGATGPQGQIGLTGPTGAQGIQGLTGAAGASGKNTLAKTTTEAAGSNCTTGGVKIEYGLDANSNGTLDISEINATLTKYVCNGAVGATGATGATGAQGIQGIQGVAGTNGTNGSNGTNGVDGKNTLAKTTTEAAGANCTTGGVKIEYGLDANNNGTLDVSEINATLTKYVCNGAVGATGAQGIQGATGATGAQGPIGLTGATGPQGIQGVAGSNGTNGTNGADGKNTLAKTTTESVGANCTNGGVKIEYGLDANSNGTLDISEINATLTKYVCNGAVGSTGAQGPQGIGGFVHYIGEKIGGGVVFHLWKDENGIEHGLIVSIENQSSGFIWSNMNTTLVGINAQSSWDGLNNSLAIISQNGHSSSSAQICIDLVSNGYSDWYLPAIDELSLLWHNRFNVNKTLSSIPNADIFSMANTFYWSSTETTFSDVAWYFAFDSGSANANLGYFKNATHRVRAIRAF
jgi:hypothetical protein